jgi:hypothetical protein
MLPVTSKGRLESKYDSACERNRTTTPRSASNEQRSHDDFAPPGFVRHLGPRPHPDTVDARGVIRFHADLRAEIGLSTTRATLNRWRRC